MVGSLEQKYEIGNAVLFIIVCPVSMYLLRYTSKASKSNVALKNYNFPFEMETYRGKNSLFAGSLTAKKKLKHAEVFISRSITSPKPADLIWIKMVIRQKVTTQIMVDKSELVFLVVVPQNWRCPSSTQMQPPLSCRSNSYRLTPTIFHMIWGLVHPIL